MRSVPLHVTGLFFIAAGAMLWLGWFLLPFRPGAFFRPGDFAAIRARFLPWIRMYRLHIFGYLVTVMAAAALAALTEDPGARALVWPGAAVMAVGAVVGALGAAFYYHVGAWGALDLAGRGEDAVEAFIAAARVSTHYATCLVRFSRVFFGLGQVVLAIGLLQGGPLPGWLAYVAAALGLAAIGLTMAIPDEMERYRPIFHLNAAWMLAVGVVVLRAGIGGPG